jgi:hypothetical protein
MSYTRPWDLRLSEDAGEQVIYVTLGRQGDVEFTTPGAWDLQRTVATIEYNSADNLRRVCHLLTEYIPAAGLVELLDAAWHINEFYSPVRPRLSSAGVLGGAAPTREGVVRMIQERPKLQLTQE